MEIPQFRRPNSYENLISLRVHNLKLASLGDTQVTQHMQVCSWRGKECLQPNLMLLLTYDRSYSEEPFRSSPPFDQSVSCRCSSMAVSISSHQELCYTVKRTRIFLRTQIQNQAIPFPPSSSGRFSISNLRLHPSTESCTQPHFWSRPSLTLCKPTAQTT